MSIEVLLFNGFGWNLHDSEPTIASTDLRIRTMRCMSTWQSPYEIVRDSGDKSGHRYQPVDRFVLRDVLVRRRVIFMQRVMMYVVSYELFGN